MDFCFSCGSKTDPDWIFCRSCGRGLDESADLVETEPVSTPAGTPKVELISRGWDDVVDIDTVQLPIDPLDEPLAAPLRGEAIEVTVDSVTVTEETEDIDEPEMAQEPVSVDPWDHLRPHGELPPLRNRTTTPARTSQIALLVVAISALAAAALRFYLNTRLDGFGAGRVTAQSVDDITMVADVGLLVMAGLAVVAAATLIWWFTMARATADFHPGPAGVVALGSAIAGAALVATFFFLEQDTVAAGLAANSLIIIGLGLVMTSCLATVRTVGRIDLEKPA